jgi:hypothetical protein
MDDGVAVDQIMAFGKGARGAGVRLLQERLASWGGFR